jgi:hypothetical protein
LRKALVSWRTTMAGGAGVLIRVTSNPRPAAGQSN